MRRRGIKVVYSVQQCSFNVSDCRRESEPGVQREEAQRERQRGAEVAGGAKFRRLEWYMCSVLTIAVREKSMQIREDPVQMC